MLVLPLCGLGLRSKRLVWLDDRRVATTQLRAALTDTLGGRILAELDATDAVGSVLALRVESARRSTHLLLSLALRQLWRVLWFEVQARNAQIAFDTATDRVSNAPCKRLIQIVVAVLLLTRIT